MYPVAVSAVIDVMGGASLMRMTGTGLSDLQRAIAHGLPVAVAAQAVGQRWVTNGRAALSRVASVIVPREGNYLIDPSHPAARAIQPSGPVPLVWDTRLFNRRALHQA